MLIRYQWQFALPRKRLLLMDIKEHSLRNYLTPSYCFITNPPSWITHVSNPTLLQVSREARQEATRFYRISPSATILQGTYIDPVWDTLIFSRHNLGPNQPSFSDECRYLYQMGLALLYMLTDITFPCGITSIAEIESADLWPMLFHIFRTTK